MYRMLRCDLSARPKYRMQSFTLLAAQPIREISLQANSGDYNADGNNSDFPNFSGSANNSHSRNDFLNTGIFTLSSFTAPAVGSQGNEKRNMFRNPSYMNFDASMLKNNRVFREKVNLQVAV